MTKLLTSPGRSRIMKAIRSKGNLSTEMRLIQIMREYRIRGWRRGSTLFGKPDFVFPKRHVIVFVDGCFWHGCPKCCLSKPKSNAGYWDDKIRSNRERDLKVSRFLRRNGWRVFRIWEHRLERTDIIARVLIRSLSD